MTDKKGEFQKQLSPPQYFSIILSKYLIIFFQYEVRNGENIDCPFQLNLLF